ncbi:uncharacterized protein LOC142323214 isoform X2 [Lycorma delicatula]|uniref:uncharacterized protein LOC142323214 isoform X2 n=1 Tax=Lycorma delicatula TaxID=130591 RepID=UPI003F513672
MALWLNVIYCTTMVLWLFTHKSKHFCNMSDCQKNVSKPTVKKPIFKPTFVPPTSTNTVKGGIKSSTTTTTKSDNVMVTKSGIVTNDYSVLSKNKIKPKTDEKSKEKTTKRPDFREFQRSSPSKA